MATRNALRSVSRRLSSSGKILNEEEKAAENVFIKVNCQLLIRVPFTMLMMMMITFFVVSVVNSLDDIWFCLQENSLSVKLRKLNLLV